MTAAWWWLKIFALRNYQYSSFTGRARALQKSPYVPQHQKGNEDREIKPHFPGLAPKSSIKSWFSLSTLFFFPSASRELAPLLCETIISEYRSVAVINLLWVHHAPPQLRSSQQHQAQLTGNIENISNIHSWASNRTSWGRCPWQEVELEGP